MASGTPSSPLRRRGDPLSSSGKSRSNGSGFASYDLDDDVSDSDDDGGGDALDAMIAAYDDEHDGYSALFRGGGGGGADDGGGDNDDNTGVSTPKRWSMSKGNKGSSSGGSSSKDKLKKPWVGLTGHQRNVKFMFYFMPILKG